MVHHTYHALRLFVICAGLFSACHTYTQSGGNTDIKVVVLESLQDPSKPYIYVGDYGFLPMGAGPGSRFLRVTIDSATFTESTSMLCVNGMVAESQNGERIEGAQAVVGTVQQFEGRIIDGSGKPPTPGPPIYHIVPRRETTTDNSGKFSLCAKIDSASSLMIANRNYFIELYEVGRLVDSTWAK